MGFLPFWFCRFTAQSHTLNLQLHWGETVEFVSPFNGILTLTSGNRAVQRGQTWQDCGAAFETMTTIGRQSDAGVAQR